jgi:UDP-4-amino-4,6-dideoxy-N-acetyl-beta-L-altrosamine transaminase
MTDSLIPYGKQDISQADIDAVIDVLKSDWLTQGPTVPAFEDSIAAYCDANYATATSSATSALHIACLSLGVSEGDIVWTSPISFVASANCALYCGAKVDFVDIDIDTGNLSPDALEQKLILAEKASSLPKVVIPVHLAGQSCDMQAIAKLAEKYNFKVIEDASHAIGAKYLGKPVGSCDYSDICVFSFHPVKIITSAEGGMAVTNCKEVDNKMKLLRSHGITSNPTEMTEPSHGPWYYQQVELGFNYRMTELQAALGLSQLTRLNEFVAKRNELACIYTNEFKHLPLTHLHQSTQSYSSYHLYIIRLTGDAVKKHKELICSLREHKITSHLHYIPIHIQPYYKGLGFREGDFPNAIEYYNTALTIPLHPKLTTSEQAYIVKKITDIV